MTVSSWSGSRLSGADERASISVTVELEAKLRNGKNEASRAKIVKINCEGLVMEMDGELAVGEEIWVQFIIKDTPYAKRCVVARDLENENNKRCYEIEFLDVNTRSQENLTKHLMQLHVQHARLARGA